MKIDLETSKKGNNFLGKEEVVSSILIVGSINNKGLRKISDSFFSFQVTSGYLLCCISLISFFRFSFRQAILRKTLFLIAQNYYTFVT